MELWVDPKSLRHRATFLEKTEEIEHPMIVFAVSLTQINEVLTFFVFDCVSRSTGLVTLWKRFRKKGDEN